MDVPPIFQDDLTLKLPPKAKLSGTKRKKNAKALFVKKPKVHFLFYNDLVLVMSSLNQWRK